MKFIHLSDLHFHRSNADNKEALAVLNYVKEKYPKHYLIITGDITDDGHEQQYKNALKALLPFKGRVFICPGNHDFGAAGNFYSYERALRFDKILSVELSQGGTFTGDNTPVVNCMTQGGDHVMLIGLDSNLETYHAFDFACGEVGDVQMDALNTILCDPQIRDMTKILFLHHHPFIHNNPFMELKDAQQLIRTIYTRVDVVLFGHKHESRMWQNVCGVQYVLAADNAPGKKYAREIDVAKGKITVKDVVIES